MFFQRLKFNMCGFAGKLNLNSLERTSYLDNQFDKAYRRLRSRGPDDKGIWIDKIFIFYILD